MKFYFVQHGEAESKDINPDRPLTDKGVEDINKLAAFLKAGQTNISNIFHSGKTRSEQTAKIFATILKSKNIEMIEGIAPNDPVDSFAIKLGHLQDNTMIVGHLPFMSRLVSFLVTGDKEKTIVDYLPGTIVCIENDVNEIWKIRWMMRPDCF